MVRYLKAKVIFVTGNKDTFYIKKILLNTGELIINTNNSIKGIALLSIKPSKVLIRHFLSGTEKNTCLTVYYIKP
ncbi:MAG: hypothetical protein EOP34_00710 [Rickettsiales bacterium]|nr:MAG: hypothetical protein EOP34_00710 [Rickettsiales bacterium]